MEPCPVCKGKASAPPEKHEDQKPCCGGEGWVQPEYDNSPPLNVVLDAAFASEIFRDEFSG